MEKESHPDTVKDKYYMTYVLFYGLGMLLIIPSQFFTTATDYWMYKFRDPENPDYSSDNRTEFQAQFTSTYSIVSHVSSMVFLMLTIFFLRRIDPVKRMVTTLCVMITIFILTIVFVQVDTDSWQLGFFIITLGMGFLLTASGAICMGTIFEILINFPPPYLPVILSGQSICGIFAAIAQILSLSIGANSKANGLVYFSIGLFFVSLILTIFLLTLKTNPFFNFYLHKERHSEKPNLTKQTVFTVLNKIKLYVFAMILVQGPTSMVHPGVTSLIVSVDEGNGNQWNDVYFVPVTTFLLYNISEYIGRECATKLRKPGNGLILLIISLCRVALVPMLMLCNEHPRHHLPVVFDSDIAYIIFIIIFSFSLGFLVNLCAFYIPTCTTKEEMKIAMVLMFVIMLTSVGACSFMGSLFVKSL